MSLKLVYTNYRDKARQRTVFFCNLNLRFTWIGEMKGVEGIVNEMTLIIIRA